MGLRIFNIDGFYVIKIENITDEEKIKEAIDKVLELRGIKRCPYRPYSIFYTNDNAYCLIDFNHLNLKEEQVEEIISPIRKK